jgi:3-methyladenine DNA glycosylase/8-oxoguanine DNA glycosylase
MSSQEKPKEPEDQGRINHPVSGEVQRRLRSEAALEGKTISEKLEEVLRSAFGMDPKPKQATA